MSGGLPAMRRLVIRTAAALAPVVALANTAWLAATSAVAAPHHLPLVELLLGEPGAPRLLARLATQPWISMLLERPFSLATPRGFAGLLAVATAASVALYASAALAALAGLALLARLWPPTAGGRGRQWWWRRGMPGAVIAAAALPIVLPLLHQDLRGDGARVIGAALAGAAALLWLAVLAATRGAAAIAMPRAAAHFGAALAAVAVAAGATSAGHDAGGRPRLEAGARPNVLLVSIDSLRADHVHAYGYQRATTPTLDALAAEGARFQTVVAPSSWTLPSHLTLLTGLPPEGHGVVDDGQRLTERALFLSEALWDAGYATAGFVSAPYLDGAYGFSQGFEHYDDYTLRRSFTSSHHGETGPVIAGLFRDWLDDWERGDRRRPFFAFLHLWDAHYDYAPPPPYDRLFDPDYRGTITGDDYESNPRIRADMDPRDLAHVVALYDGEIRFVDATLGGILEQLRRRGLLDDTIVVVTADHGEEFFEHGRRGHKQTLFDESILVPLIVRYPARVPAATVVGEQVRLMDVAPTILALADVPPPAGFAGAGAADQHAARDLTPWMTAPPAARPPALPAFTDLVGDAPVPLAAIRTGQYKLIRERRAGGRDALYDLARDPGERVNLIAEPPPAALALGAELSDWRRAWSPERLAAKAELSAAHRERLRALGYLP